MISPPVCFLFNNDGSKETLQKYWVLQLIYMGNINEDMCYADSETWIM